MALREGEVKSRFYGIDNTARLGWDEGINPTDWYSTGVLGDGSVIFQI
jgi:hypothetical protein